MAVQPIGAAPTARLSFGRLAAINAFWFGGGAHWQPIYISLIPVGATLIAGSNADLLIGRVTAAGGVFALLTPILVGWLSDRTVTRWGRRRPWMVAGTVLNIIGLGLLALSSSQLTFVAAYLVVHTAASSAPATPRTSAVSRGVVLSSVSASGTVQLMQSWNSGSEFATTDMLTSAWNFLAGTILPEAAGLAVVGAIFNYARHRPFMPLIGSGLAFLSVSAIWKLVQAMAG